jgi:DegV family protein with EDD domain
MINILTDSTADLSDNLLEKYQIKTIPMYVSINGRTYRDGEEMTGEELFRIVEKTGQYPTTSAPSPNDFIKFFDRKGPSIYIGVSNRLSSTYKNAQLALKELGKKSITLINSLSISVGYGQTVLQAAEWRDMGIGFDELVTRIRNYIPRTRGIFILDSLDYLFHGGRCSAVDHFVASLLKIRPFLNIRPNGTLGILQKVRGTRQKAVKALLDFFQRQLNIFPISKLTIAHLNCEDEVNFLLENINRLKPSLEIDTASVGCVLANHSGPKPLGIAYVIDEY